ncbi:WYL domain-containing protein [Pseudoflavonifractor phocaeensis]|uniref:WYL domain-containing protein n=1 Tax=Pseudoflavonifractor phocaeensis TaxID=1870988 RepID=UPI00195707A8|nr:WYL domain-containing protein [Pseudoflavonifractor phocaeensis]MBM6938932.1 WYL domain-containing protein [Pseudoflavonifractor phocaeensis]
MPFVIKDEDQGGNNKQHLNLSTLAYEVISSDMFTFGEEKLSGFINTVFEYYYPLAEASIGRSLNRLIGELDKCLSNIPGDEKTKQQVLERLVSQKKERLIEKAKSYESGKTFKFWLNKRNLEYLTERNSECCEERYYTKRGKYIKCVLEEYARLPYIDREKIYFSPLMEEIQAAIRDKSQLRVVTGRDVIYSVYPYDILSDPLSTTNYLVGYCTRYGNSEDEKRPCSFRISALKSIRQEKSKSAFLKASLWKQLSQTITSRGVQFLVGNETEIHVKLTKAGVTKYRRQTHLRPPFVREQDNGIYVFQCTTAQAEFYFFKFGKDAEIIHPAELRNKFKIMYEAAINTYICEGGQLE